MMFTSQSIDYSLSTPTRCLASLPSRSSSNDASTSRISNADNDEEDNAWEEDSYKFDNNQDTHRFLVATACPSISKPDSLAEGEEEEENNYLHVLTYHEDSHEITLDGSYPHPTGEIWALAPHPKNDTVVTCGGGVLLSDMGEEGAVSSGNLMEFSTKLWKISDEEEDDFGLSSSGVALLEPLITIPHGEDVVTQSGWERRVGCILWNPALSSDDTDEQDMSASLLTVGWDKSSPITLWDLSNSVAVETWSCNSSSRKSTGRRKYNLHSALPRRASWDPHEPSNILCTADQDVVSYDMRCSANSNGVGVIRNAHRYGVADVDHNRLQENVVVTSGLDGVIKFWDLRMHLSSSDNSRPPCKLLKTVRGGHSHWATHASYNPFYDQLVLSGGTDGIANLWRISSCSSAPLLDFDGDDDEIHNNSQDGMDEEVDEGGDGDDNWTREKEEVVDEDNPEQEDNPDQAEEKKDNVAAKPSSNDIRVARFECSDTTAGVCWSVSDPWMYASLSCDGSLAVHHVPSKEKYKILL